MPYASAANQYGNNGLFYLHSDHLGSASAMSDANGSQVGATTRYTPFGSYRAGGPNEITDRGFTGHRHNDDLGLIYMNARYYVKGIGRFASADTIVPNPTNPQAYNRYSNLLKIQFSGEHFWHERIQGMPKISFRKPVKYGHIDSRRN